MNISETSDNKSMNILQSYIKKYGQFIVMILGMPCTNKSEIAKELVIDLKLPILNINDYLIHDKFIDKKVDGLKFKLYEHPDNYDWDKLNRDVNYVKSSGLILYGNYLDIDKINWKPDFNFFISMNTNICKLKLIEKNLLPNDKDDEKVKIYFTKIFNPIYDELKEKIKFNKFFNVKETTTFDEIYNELFDLLMKLISDRIKGFKSNSGIKHKPSYQKHNKQEYKKVSNKIETSDDIEFTNEQEDKTMERTGSEQIYRNDLSSDNTSETDDLDLSNELSDDFEETS